MEKRKITKFRPLCPSDISPCKRETKQKISPLTKGRLGGVCAFTLVELIVVITILAILGTIAFVSLQNYTKDARDAKRITDIKSLIDKVNIEQVKGVPLSSLITEATTHSTKINGQLNNSGTYQGIVNFETIREDSKNFQDPLTKTNYPFAYTEGITQVNGESKSYRFMQIATINERNGTTQLVGNYFKYNEQEDDESLFMSENGQVMKSGEPPMIYDPNNNDGNETENPPITYNNCSNQTVDGYDVPATNHGESTGELEKDIEDGIKSMTFTCNNGTFQGGVEDIVCNENYVNQGGACTSNTCDGYIPTNATQNGGQQINVPWSYSEVSGVCKFKCSTGYSWDGNNCDVQEDVGGCVSPGTQISIENGQTKNVEALVVGDKVKTYNLFTGQVEYKPILEVSAIIDINPSATLYFENGKTLNIQSSHVLFDKTLGRYVRLFAFGPSWDEKDYIGHTFHSEWGDLKLLNIDRHSNEYTKKWAYDLTAGDGDIVYFADGFMGADTNQDFLQFFEVNTGSMIYDYNSVANWINGQSSLNYTSSDVDTESEIRTVLELNDLIFTKNELVSILSGFGITLSEETQNYARENLIKPYRYDFAKINIIKGTMEEQYYQDSLMRYAQQLSQ